MERRRPRRRPMSEINVVPYIDVMLVLLIIFMVTAPLLMQGVQVELPQAAAEPVAPDEVDPLVVAIKEDGPLYLNVGGDQGQALTLEAGSGRVGKVLGRRREAPVLIGGERRTAE